MLTDEDLKILRCIDTKVVMYPHEIADQLWPDEPERNLKIGQRIKTLESDGWLVRRGDRKSYVILTKKADKHLEDIKALDAAKDMAIFGEEAKPCTEI